MQKSAKVVIAGSGPSAAFAVMACWYLGIMPRVYSDKPPRSQQTGAFFLHWTPSELTGYPHSEPIWVRIEGRGTAAGYTCKQWGKVIPSSFPVEPELKRMFDSRVLDNVWTIQPWEKRCLTSQELIDLGKENDWVFHTFPASPNGRAVLEIPTLVKMLEQDNPTDNLKIIYSGVEDGNETWVRKTIGLTHISVEYPIGMTEFKSVPELGMHPRFVRLRDLMPDVEPVSESEYLAPNVIPIGRWATFDRHALSHQAYFDVKRRLLAK